jgi:hypothetical protein
MQRSKVFASRRAQE